MVFETFCLTSIWPWRECLEFTNDPKIIRYIFTKKNNIKFSIGGNKLKDSPIVPLEYLFHYFIFLFQFIFLLSLVTMTKSWGKMGKYQHSSV